MFPARPARQDEGWEAAQLLLEESAALCSLAAELAVMAALHGMLTAVVYLWLTAVSNNPFSSSSASTWLDAVLLSLTW